MSDDWDWNKKKDDWDWNKKKDDWDKWNTWEKGSDPFRYKEWRDGGEWRWGGKWNPDKWKKR